MDKALQIEARECLAVRAYLQQLDQPQVAFSVKQSGPKTLDDAVTATLEMESYVPLFPRTATVAPLQKEEDLVTESSGTPTIAAVDPTEKLATMHGKLMERVETLEARHSSPEPKQQQGRWETASQKSRGRLPIGRRRREFRGVCWNCLQPGHIARNCPMAPSKNY